MSNLSAMNEAQLTKLIQQVQKGKQSAFMQLVSAYQTALRGFVAMRLNSPQYVDDIAQESFLLAFDKISQLENPTHFKAWLFGIAQNLIRNHNRKFDPLKYNDEDAEVLNTLITQQLETELTISDSENLIQQLLTCVKSLNQDIQQLVEKFYIENCSLKDLTQLYQVKHSTITMRLHRARGLLRECVEQELKKDHHE